MGLTTLQSFATKLNLASVGKPVLAGAVALAVVVAVVAGKTMIDTATANEFEVEPARSQEDQTHSAGQAGPGAQPAVVVHVAGCVNRPGVVELDDGARVSDAVEAAGGFTGEAAQGSVNLARPVKDGEQVVIPSVEEAASAEHAQAQQQAQPEQGQAARAQGLVNINTAGAGELQSLPGIGAATAARILDYRSANGPFASCEDLKNVSGIGDKKYEAIADLICV